MEATNSQGLLFAIGINHKTAPLEAREKLFIHDTEIPELLALLRQTLSECVILSTCNRTEIYGVCNEQTIDLDFYKELLIEFKSAGNVVEKDHFFTFVSCAACRQLFNVATSVDSKIIGDTQILQQFKSAYHTAKDLDATGRILNQLSQRAFKIGKKVYTETTIHKGAVSISLAGVRLAKEILGTLADKRILVVGAGETAELTAKCLLKQQVGKIFFTNRTKENTEKLLSNLRKSHRFNGEILDFEDFRADLNKFDLVISSTSATEPILRQEDFAAQTNEILLVDIAMPRDIALDVTKNELVTLKNIDDLNQLIDRNYERRMENLPGVKKIIMKEMGEFLMWYYSLSLMPNFKKTHTKPDRKTVGEILKIKSFLMENVSELHKLAMKSKGNDTDDLQNHFELVKKLQVLKQETFGEADA